MSLSTMLPRGAAALLLWAATLAGHAQAAPADIGPVPVVRNDSGLPPQWQRGPFMEIYVRGYQDSDGDGIGDLNGVTARLDYLRDLGIRGIWLMPVFESEDQDHGYAVRNYRAIEPAYGTMADFDRLLAEAHKRGIGVIVDYVINHSASAHPAFEDSYDSRQSRFKDWYIWSEDKPKGWNTFSGEPWREGNQRWYYGVFDVRMPDFNLRNPEVLAFHENNLRFWLNRGVDGFRFDAVGVLVENSAIAWENQPENHQVMKRMQDVLAGYGNRFMVCESPSDPAPFAQPDSCGSAFGFGLQKQIIRSIKLGRFTGDQASLLRSLPMDRLSTLLANHDFFAGARLARQFRDDERGYRLAAATLLTLPGRPFLYYGEEIGLGQSEPVKEDDHAIRGPMAWSGAANGGFTTAARPYRPLVTNWQTNNVARQAADPNSLFHWYKALIALRHAEPALHGGTLRVLSARDDPVFAFEREADGSRLLVLLNYAYREVRTTLPEGFDPKAWKARFPAAAPAPAFLPKAGAPGRYELALPPQSMLVLGKAP